MTPAPRICAVFVFNHKFERNLPLLERLYGHRFAHRHVIMPFASRTGPGLSRVYEMGRTFSGHIAQGARDFIDPDFTHYAFISDDLILNPALDERNLLERLKVGPGEGWIKNLAPLDGLRYRWSNAGEAAMALRKWGRGMAWQAELPDAAAARARFEALGLRFSAPKPGLSGLAYQFGGLPRLSVWAAAMTLAMTGREADYPLLSGYSDFFVVPAEAIEPFAHYCGVFAALGVFAEVAVPTALALTAGRVVTELAPGEHFMDADARRSPDAALRGVEFWEAPAAEAFAARAGHKLDQLAGAFPADWLYVHPVKLSGFA